MRKLFLIVVMVLVGFGTKAQIQIEETYTNDLIIIGQVSAGAALNALSSKGPAMAEHQLYCRVFKEQTTYGILIDSPNSYDDDLEFTLGETIEQAQQSIETLIKFLDEKPRNTSVNIKDQKGRTFQLTNNLKNSFAIKVFDAKGDVIVTNGCNLTKNNLTRASELLATKAEARVKKAIEKNNKK